MLARISSFAFSGIEAVPVEVQVQIASGLPSFAVVGLPDKAVAEARERVRAALTSMGLSLPPKRIIINLAPADLLKEGSHFDLPIALAVLAAMDVLPRGRVGRVCGPGRVVAGWGGEAGLGRAAGGNVGFAEGFGADLPGGAGG